ncbi:hypothetical protein tb265_22690 [Gemmatimonadetes bacterium T265]|nr:hypothetical protein tb265_22690 [Gemmatimonadetes bacterium T265]
MVDPHFSRDPDARYVIEREIGRGGSAVVYLARDRKHGRFVALKVLDPSAGPVGGAARFHREISLLARLHHPHILPLHDSGEARGALYFVMPYVEGETLRSRLTREGALPPGDALRVAAEVADALAYAHARHVVHRDIKPENVMLSGYAPAAGATPGLTTTTAATVARWHAVVCDFGIARLTGRESLDRTGGDDLGRVTRAGHAVGTPVYMAPEQATGDPHVDARSDVWSLGVLLYEMLTGVPPHADVTSPLEAMRRRLTGPAPVVGTRPGLPPETTRLVDAIVARALAPDPAQRYASADAFADDVRAAQAALAGTGAVRRRRSPRRIAALAAGLAVAGAVGLWVRGQHTGAAADPALVVVLPFADERAPSGDTGAGAGRDAAAGVDGHDAEQLLLDAMSRWTGLRLVNATRVHDALTRRGVAAPRTLDEALAIARELGAGRLAWGTIARPPRAVSGTGAVAVRAALYDVAHPDSTRREHTIYPTPVLADLGRQFGTLADTLLLGTARSRVSVAGAFGTASWNAWRAYDRGHDALARWDLDGAAQAFGEAAQLDPDYALAYRWQAQAYAWMVHAPSADWRRAATRAVALAGHLPPADAEAAQALSALADDRYPDACRLYRAIVRRDSMDLAAWYGLGDCQAKDSVVVRDAQSPSGWRFRSSYSGAIAAYQRVFVLLPSVHLAFRGNAASILPRLLVANYNQLRPGLATDGARTTRMVAFPTLAGDTLAFVPYPPDVVGAGGIPATTHAAVARNRAVLLDVATRWANAFPRSSDVLGVLAVAREGSGELLHAADGGPGALDATRRARLLTPAGPAVAELGRAEVRILLKLHEVARATALADTLLAAPGAGDADARASLAALTGRTQYAAAVLRAATAEPALPEAALVPPAARGAARALVAYAAAGGPNDSIFALRAFVSSAVRAGVPAARTPAAFDALLGPAMPFAFPTLGGDALRDLTMRGDYLVEIQRDVARGDRTGAARRFARLDSARGSLTPADMTLDVLYQETWLRLAIGDSAGASSRLAFALDGLAGASDRLIEGVPRAAALGRCLALRAELAARAGDTSRARAAALDVLTLWRHADPALRPTVERMRVLAAARRAPERG